jgi:hypothetical protein
MILTNLVYFEFILSLFTIIFLWSFNQNRGLHTASYYMSQDAQQTLFFMTICFVLLLSRLTTIFISWSGKMANFFYLMFILLQFYTLFSLTAVTICFDVDIHNNLSAVTMLFALLAEISSVFLNKSQKTKNFQIFLVMIFVAVFIYFIYTVLTLKRNDNYECSLDNFLEDPELYVPKLEIVIYVLIAILPLFRIYW